MDRARDTRQPHIAAFFHEPTFTVSYVVHDPETRQAAIIDSVLDFDQAAGRISSHHADRIVGHVKACGLEVAWHLETHVHADHLSAATRLKELVGGKLAIGRPIVEVQRVFSPFFSLPGGHSSNGSEFDLLLDDGDRLPLGNLAIDVLHVPGHTPADIAFLIGDAAFVGDTLFMPDYGTARADFPGGDARRLYRSIRRLLSLPGHTRLFLCHDYKAPGRDEYCWETTVADQRAANIHVRDGVDEDSFVTMREARDAQLAVPQLFLPSLQVNMRAGNLPCADENGIRYLKLPLDQL